MRTHRTLGQHQHDELHHERDERKPDERHHDVEAGVRVGDLSRDDLDSLASGRNGRNDCREGASQTDEEQTADKLKMQCARATRLASATARWRREAP